MAAAANYFREQKQSVRAYGIVTKALQFNENSPQIWEQYALLSVEQGLLAQSEEGVAKVEQLATDADYQAFLNRYQPMRALIEKQRAEFQ